MSDLFNSGIRPIIDNHLLQESQQVRDYGEFWSASSAGYCMRKVMFERLGVPKVEEENAARKQRVFSAGHIFHDWIQGLTREAGVSIAQEIELIDEDLMIIGHFDDLVLVDGKLILYDFKTVNSRSFMWARKQKKATGTTTMSRYHYMQLGTYMHEIRRLQGEKVKPEWLDNLPELEESRILKIEKDTLMMDEQQLMWSPELEKEVVGYWRTLNGYWKAKKLPKCTCADHEGGFMAREGYNPYFYNDEPCSLKWFKLCKEAGTIKAYQEKR